MYKTSNLCGRPGIGPGMVALLGMLAGALAQAAPVELSAEVVTDVKLGSQAFHNAAVTIRFVTDSALGQVVVDQTGAPIQSGNCSGPSFFWITQGDASVTIESQGESITAHFLPGQLFATADACNGGIGFGSYVASGLEPAYPLAFTRGTAEAYAGGAYETGPTKVFAPTYHVSGNAFSCVGYVNVVSTGDGTQCVAPDPYPLKTSKGNFFIYMPYNNTTYGYARDYSLNRGLFSAVPVAP